MYRVIGYFNMNGSHNFYDHRDRLPFNMPNMKVATTGHYRYVLLENAEDNLFYAATPCDDMSQYTLGGTVKGNPRYTKHRDLDALIAICVYCSRNPAHEAQVFLTEKEHRDELTD